MKTIALQLYTVRHALAADPENTLRRVREMGYRSVETAPLPPELPTARVASLLRDNGLSVLSTHCDLPLGDRQDQVLDEAEMLGTRRIIWHGWPKDPCLDSLSGHETALNRYTMASLAANARGLRFGLHNHWWEFEPIDGVSPYRWMHQRLPPEIFFQLDVYWVQTAGLDPVQVLRELGARVQLLHLKDGPAVHGRAMTALGEGVVNIPNIIEESRMDEGWVIELDECDSDPMEAARRSLEFATKLSRCG